MQKQHREMFTFGREYHIVTPYVNISHKIHNVAGEESRSRLQFHEYVVNFPYWECIKFLGKIVYIINAGPT